MTSGDSNRCLKVFFPQRCCGCQSGYLLGYYINPMTVCVESICRASGQQFGATPSTTLSQPDSEAAVVLGFICDLDNDDQSYVDRFKQFKQSHHHWIKLYISWNQGYCRIQYKNNDKVSCLLIIYQQSGKGTFMSNQALQQVVIQASDNYNSDILPSNSSELENCLKYINKTQNQSYDHRYLATKQPFNIVDFLFLTFVFHIANIIWLKLRHARMLLWVCKWIKMLLYIVRYQKTAILSPYIVYIYV